VLCRRISPNKRILVYFAEVLEEGTNGRNSLWRSTKDLRAVGSCRGERGVKVSSFLIISLGEVRSIDPSQRGSSDLLWTLISEFRALKGQRNSAGVAKWRRVENSCECVAYLLGGDRKGDKWCVLTHRGINL